MQAKFAKMGFIPYDDVGESDFMEASPTWKEGVNGGWEVFKVLMNEFALESGEQKEC